MQRPCLRQASSSSAAGGAVLALVVVLQNVGPALTSGGEDDPVRFRSAHSPVTSTAPADLSLRWKAGASVAARKRVLRGAAPRWPGRHWSNRCRVSPWLVESR